MYDSLGFNNEDEIQFYKALSKAERACMINAFCICLVQKFLHCLKNTFT